MKQDEIEVLSINGIEYVKKDSVSKASGTIRIVILQRGWIAVGYFNQVGEQCTLTQCAHIRQWGTTKGLGEIAIGGPTSKTILDKCPTIRFHELTIVHTIDCLESVWQNKI